MHIPLPQIHRHRSIPTAPASSGFWRTLVAIHLAIMLAVVVLAMNRPWASCERGHDGPADAPIAAESARGGKGGVA